MFLHQMLKSYATSVVLKPAAGQGITAKTTQKLR